MKYFAALVSCAFFLIAAHEAEAKGGKGGRPSYSGGKHSSGHSGSYSGGSGSSHRGGTYKNPKSGDRYGTHK